MAFFSLFTDLFSPGKGKSGGRPSGRIDSLRLTLSGSAPKQRRKSVPIAADPVDAKSLGFDVSLKREDSRARSRKAVRIEVDGLSVLVRRLGRQFPVANISATGLGFAFEKPRIRGGVDLEMDLILNGKTRISGVMTKVMRHDHGAVGCAFRDLDRAQDDAVHAIVLLGQKQLAARRHAMDDGR